jgi:RNA polymerase sigma-70 factor (ECF subfamily)
MTAFVAEGVLPRPALLERARSGDHDAFAALVAEHEAMVYSLAYNFFRDRGRAEELAQDVFLQLFRSLPDLETPEHVVYWLRQVTTRRCIDAVRRMRFRLVPLDESAGLQHEARGSDPFLRRRLRDLIAALPPKQRMIVTLRYQEDLDPSEICRIVGLPVNTVKSHLHRALVWLRKNLGETP